MRAVNARQRKLWKSINYTAALQAQFSSTKINPKRITGAFVDVCQVVHERTGTDVPLQNVCLPLTFMNDAAQLGKSNSLEKMSHPYLALYNEGVLLIH